MRCLPAVILAVLLVAAEGKVVPASDVESQQTDAQQSSFQLSEHINDAKEQINNLGALLQQHLPNQEEFLNTMQQQSSNFVNNLQAYLKNMTEEVSVNIFNTLHTYRFFYMWQIEMCFLATCRTAAKRLLKRHFKAADLHLNFIEIARLIHPRPHFIVHIKVIEIKC